MTDSFRVAQPIRKGMIKPRDLPLPGAPMHRRLLLSPALMWWATCVLLLDLILEGNCGFRMGPDIRQHLQRLFQRTFCVTALALDERHKQNHFLFVDGKNHTNENAIFLAQFKELSVLLNGKVLVVGLFQIAKGNMGEPIKLPKDFLLQLAVK